jgi:hypothetical protein
MRIVERLVRSQKDLLTAQVFMNDRMERVEQNLEKMSAQLVTLGQKVEALADAQKHTDDKLDALSDIVRRWVEGQVVLAPCAGRSRDAILGSGVSIEPVRAGDRYCFASVRVSLFFSTIPIEIS